jgi:hypothetical protein
VLDLVSAGFPGERLADAALASASCVGSLLSAKMSSLSRQRLTTKALRRLEQHLCEGPESSACSAIGTAATACHITISSSLLPGVPASSQKNISDAVFRALDGDFSLGPVSKASRSALRKLLLAAVLKLVAAAPADLSGKVPLLATGAMRCFAADPDPASDVAGKLLALQVLESVASLPLGGPDRDDRSALRPAVIAILSGAMNHPSSLIRQASVDVRNAWYALGQM